MRKTKFWKDADGDGLPDKEGAEVADEGVTEEGAPDGGEDASEAAEAKPEGSLLPPPPPAPPAPPVPPAVNREDGLERTMMLDSGGHDALEASIKKAIADGELPTESPEDAEAGDEDDAEDSVELMPSGSIDVSPGQSQKIEKPVYELICPACYHKPPMGTETGVDGQCTECGDAYFIHAKSHEKFGGDPHLGNLLDENYIVIGVIGQGGFGTVYRAVQRSVNREVAIKVIRLSGGDQENLSRRFEREARVIASLEHPNIVTLYDFGVLEDGTLYMVQELINGHELADELVNKKPLGFVRATRIVAAALDALVVAHDDGLVHRDLKPANIMLVQDRRGGELIKVLDFGIAKVTEGDEGVDEKLTQTGMVFGTPHYMAPEQSGSDPVDGRCDLYAMGIVLFQLLSGHLPFDSGSTFDILLAHRSQPVPELPEAIPETLRQVVYKALEKHPDQRFPDAFTMAAALRESIGDMSGGSGVHQTIRPMSKSTNVSALQSMGINVGGSTSMIDVSAQKPRRALMFAIVTILVIAVGAAAAFFMSKANEEREAKAQAELALHNAQLKAKAAKLESEREAKKARAEAEEKAKAAAKKAAEANEKVTFTITSTPEGAEVFRKEGNLSLGKTPFTRTDKTAEGDEIFVLKKAGYKELQVVLSASAGGTQDVVLEALAKKKRSTSGSRSRGGKKKKIADDGFVNPFE
jgi:serine/threonine protein kinase